MVQWSGLRVAAVLKLGKEPLSEEMLEKMLKQRKLKKKCADFDASVFHSCCTEWAPPAPRKLSGGYDVYDSTFDGKIFSFEDLHSALDDNNHLDVFSKFLDQASESARRSAHTA